MNQLSHWDSEKLQRIKNSPTSISLLTLVKTYVFAVGRKFKSSFTCCIWFGLVTFGYDVTGWVNLLKPTGPVIHQQFNIQQLYALPTLYLCVLYLSENKQRLVPLTA